MYICIYLVSIYFGVFICFFALLSPVSLYISFPFFSFQKFRLAPLGRLDPFTDHHPQQRIHRGKKWATRNKISDFKKLPYHIIEKLRFPAFLVSTSYFVIFVSVVPCAVCCALWCAECVFSITKKQKCRGFHRDKERRVSTRG